MKNVDDWNTVKKRKTPGFGFKYFDAVDEGLDDFCEKWGLEPYYGVCGDCKAELYVNIPYYGSGMRGLRADFCKCGSGHVPFSYMKIDPSDPLNMLIGPSCLSEKKKPKFEVLDGGKTD